MTHKEIEEYRGKLIEILHKPNSTENEHVKELRTLALKVGASIKTAGGNRTANEGELVYGIQTALQTASMIETCRISSRQFLIAIVASIIALLSALAAWVAVLAR